MYMNLMLLTFGSNLENHYQAVFSIASFLKDSNIENVIIVTDRIDFYKFFNSERIKIIEVNSELLEDWKGKYAFFWRVKIKAIQMVYEQYPEKDLLYVDSDTFLVKSLDNLKADLRNGKPFMHLKEELLSDGKSKTVRNMWQHLKGQIFAENIVIDESSAMWNAGVIALPASQAKNMIDLSLRVCDEICQTDCPRRLVEQFAFSIAINFIEPLQPANNVIAHYWGNKDEWNIRIREIITYSFLNARALDDFLQAVSNFDITDIPIQRKTSSTAYRLKSLIDKIFKPKKVIFFE